MKKIAIIALIGASIALSGCQAIKENPGLGVALGVAGGAVAASIATHNKDGDNKADHHHKRDHKREQDQFRYDQSRHQRGQRHLPDCDFSHGNPSYTCVDGVGEIYRP